MRIKIFTTGGSLDKAYSTRESAFVVQEPRIEEILAEGNVTFEYEIESLFRKDSLEIGESDRKVIVEAVKGEPCECILITHGTDTMPEPGQRLSSIPGKTIVLTGAKQPASFKHTGSSKLMNRKSIKAVRSPMSTMSSGSLSTLPVKSTQHPSARPLK